MTSVLRRVVAPFAAVTALVATMSACGTGPNQVNSAAIVGDRVISVDQVQSLVDKVVKQPAARSLAQQHKLDLVAREALSQLIIHDALLSVARRDGLKVDEDQLAEARKQNTFTQEMKVDPNSPPEAVVAELVYRARGFDAYVSDQLLLTQLAEKRLGRDSAKYNVVTMPNDEAARELAEKIVANPGDAASLMRAASKDDPQAGLGLGQETGPTLDGLILEVPGPNYVFVLPGSQGDTGTSGPRVVHVISMEKADSVSPDLDTSQVDPSQLPDSGRYVLRPYLMDSGIKISPRYGVWNYLRMNVVPKAEADVSGYVLRPKTDKP